MYSLCLKHFSDASQIKNACMTIPGRDLNQAILHTHQRNRGMPTMIERSRASIPRPHVCTTKIQGHSTRTLHRFTVTESNRMAQMPAISPISLIILHITSRAPQVWRRLTSPCKLRLHTPTTKTTPCHPAWLTTRLTHRTSLPHIPSRIFLIRIQILRIYIKGLLQ